VAYVSTAMLMEHFYRRWRGAKMPPAEALRVAQRWLRDTFNHEKAEYFKLQSGAIRHGMPEGVAVEFYTQIMSRDLESRDFAHPSGGPLFIWPAC
jgi:CHAT domain-containing protein